MIKAIMLDVDGTLVSFETHKVLPSSVDALRGRFMTVEFE